MTVQQSRPRVVILGGGFGGVAAARRLGRGGVDVVIVDKRNHHIFQPLLYQVATGILSPSDISAPIRQMTRAYPSVSTLLGLVVRIDPAARHVVVVRGDADERSVSVTYDYLVVAAGMQPSYFGHDDFAPFAPSLKTIEDAEAVRDRILSAFETAEATSDPEVRLRHLSFVLVGGGATGVELAASLAQFARSTLPDFRRLDIAELRIRLIEGGDRILPAFDSALAVRARVHLEKVGIEVLTGVRVEHIDNEGVVAGGERIQAATVLWTAGVRPSAVVEGLAATVDRAGRILVGPDLRIPERSEVFVVGDAASLEQDGKTLPGVAQVAIQQGRYAAEVILAQIGGGAFSPKPFRYRDKGSMAVVGKNFAVLETRHLRRSGFLPWITWVLIHVLFLPQNQNRMRVPFQWLWTYVTGQRGSRLIHERKLGRASPLD